MKKLLLTGSTFLFLLSLSVIVSAQTDKDLFSSIDPSTHTNIEGKSTIRGKSTSKYAVIETNYLVGLNSDNPGIETSCAYFLGEMKSEKALFPLMKIFREAKSDGVKLLAAWSLLKIGDNRGVYLVKQEAENGDRDDIRPMLEWLYKDYSLKTLGKID